MLKYVLQYASSAEAQSATVAKLVANWVLFWFAAHLLMQLRYWCLARPERTSQTAINSHISHN